MARVTLNELLPGDLIQIWIDRAGYAGRIGRVERIVRQTVFLRLGDGEVVKLDIKRRSARVQMDSRQYPIKGIILKERAPTTKSGIRRTR